MNIKVVIFDCDGVMFDTVKSNTAYYNNILRHFGNPEMTSEQFAYCHMHTADESLAYLFDEEELEAAQVYRKRMSYEPFFKQMEIEPYLKPLLRKLRPKYKTAVATNRTDTMDRVLSIFDLEKDFDLVVTALDVERPKPYPDALNRVLAHYETDSHEAIYIGDSVVDETASDAAGIPFVAYKNSSLKAAFHIADLREIEDILGV